MEKRRKIRPSGQRTRNLCCLGVNPMKTKNKHAVALGKKGGKSKSLAKQAAARANGAKAAKARAENEAAK